MIRYLEEFAECNVVEAVRTVEHNALLGNGLRQIFGRFGLAGSRGPLGRPAQMQVNRTEQSSTEISRTTYSEHMIRYENARPSCTLQDVGTYTGLSILEFYSPSEIRINSRTRGSSLKL